ncbi:hypothetical protein K504DRAFT_288016 [Pleomassaria siparia CBS 279.74]|uniref:Uncharacterized protein n=1 Tax=Pleomassaria siparia CBS 279.74 TaxID=1314801 RepID=A0A6G1K8G6_9PLEO|nr:hypothetical protein K504DRAFT_288016 [Pleomassaria siparia CBS 279.74]
MKSSSWAATRSRAQSARTCTYVHPSLDPHGHSPSLSNSSSHTDGISGDWGNPYAAGGQPGKGTVAYAMSSNRLNPMAGFIRKGVRNLEMRRSKR